MQEEILRNIHAGEFSYERAARALSEFGRGSSRMALWRVAIGEDAPVTARIQALSSLSKMQGDIRFASEVDALRQEMMSYLPQIFNEPAPATVQIAAIDAIIAVSLKELGTYLVDLIFEDQWHLRHAARRACDQLDFKLTPRQQRTFLSACREQLEKIEEQLYQETLVSQITKFNQERQDILGWLTTPDDLPLLLKRRFGYSIHEYVGKHVDQVIYKYGMPPAEAQLFWIILAEQPKDLASTIDYWLQLLRDSDDLTAIAAAHRLMGVGKDLPGEKLRLFLDPALPPDRLSAIAQLIATCQDKSLAEPLSNFVRSLVETVTTPADMEAFTNLTDTLFLLDEHLGRCMSVVAHMMFFAYRRDTANPGCFPWRIFCMRDFLNDDVIRDLLLAGGDDARAVLFELATHSVGYVGDAVGNLTFIKLDSVNKQQLLHEAISEQSPYWQHKYALVSVITKREDLLPWLMHLDSTATMASDGDELYASQYGLRWERYLTMILRAIGYLARFLLDEKREVEAQPAVTFLHDRYMALQQDEDRDIVIGLTTGLGLLGNWKPILTHLGPGEPWMHEAALNVFRNSLIANDKNAWFPLWKRWGSHNGSQPLPLSPQPGR